MKKKSKVNETITATLRKKEYDKERKRLALGAWKVFSQYVRSKGADFTGRSRCYTCHRLFDWKELDAGHYRHTYKTKAGKTKAIDYDERNIHPQCTYCNRMLHGNLARYSMALEAEYGHGIIQTLHQVYMEARELTNLELREVIEKYSMESNRGTDRKEEKNGRKL